jgi:hypothetical protein
MIISDAEEFILVHNFKVAGSSVKAALRPYATTAKSAVGWRPFLDRQLVRLGLKKTPSYPDHHTTAVEARRTFPDEWTDYFTFAFVRNPWSWQVSLYFYMRQHRFHYQHDLIQSMDGFEEYVEWRVTEDKVLQSDLVCDEEGSILTDFVGRLETIRDDFATICDRLGLDATLPHENQSSHRDYRSYYTDRPRRLVAEHFREDIERFGYEFEGLRDTRPVVSLPETTEAG